MQSAKTADCLPSSDLNWTSKIDHMKIRTLFKKQLSRDLRHRPGGFQPRPIQNVNEENGRLKLISKVSLFALLYRVKNGARKLVHGGGTSQKEHEDEIRVSKYAIYFLMLLFVPANE